MDNLCVISIPCELQIEEIRSLYIPVRTPLQVRTIQYVQYLPVHEKHGVVLNPNSSIQIARPYQESPGIPFLTLRLGLILR